MKFLEAVKIFNDSRNLRKKKGTINGDDGHIRNFAVFMRNCEIENITDEHVAGWSRLNSELGYSTSAIIKKEQALINFFKYWRRKGLDTFDPFLIEPIKREYTKPAVCTDSQYLQLLEATPLDVSNFHSIRNRAIVTLLWNTGMRRTELAHVNLSDFDENKKVVTIKTAKTRGIAPFRTIPYNIFDENFVEVFPIWKEKRAELLQSVELKDEDKDALFIGLRYGNHLSVGGARKENHEVKRLADDSISDIFSKMVIEANISDNDYFSPHAMRHHLGNALAKRGFDNSIISLTMGHSSLQSSYRYTQLQGDNLVEALRGGNLKIA